MTTVREKRNKVPVFIEDIVMDPSIKRRDVLQIAPKPKPAKPEDEKPLETSSGELFPAGDAPPKIFFPNCQVGGGIPSGIARAAEAQLPPRLKITGSARSSTRSAICGLEGRPARDAELRKRDPHHDQTFPRTVKKGVKLPFDEVQRIYETEWTSAGYEDEYQEAEYKKTASSN